VFLEEESSLDGIFFCQEVLGLVIYSPHKSQVVLPLLIFIA